MGDDAIKVGDKVFVTRELKQIESTAIDAGTFYVLIRAPGGNTLWMKRNELTKLDTPQEPSEC